MKSSRIGFLDTIGGFLILIMIDSHLEAKCWQSNFKLTGLLDFFNFFMPWFFYKSGMFYKQKKFSDLLSKGKKKLLIPYVCFFVLSIPLFHVELAIRHDINWTHYLLSPFKALLLQQALDTNSPIWFLLSLFVVQVIYNFLNIKTNGNKLHSMLFLFIALFIGYGLNFCNFSTPFILANVSTGLFFYGMGDLLRATGKPSFKQLWIPCGIVYLLGYFWFPSQLSMYMNRLTSGNYLLWAIMSLLGIMCINGGLKYFRFNSFLDAIGRNSMSYYLFHYPIIVVVYFVCHDACMISDTYTYFCMIAILCVSLPVLNSFVRKSNFKWLLGI